MKNVNRAPLRPLLISGILSVILIAACVTLAIGHTLHTQWDDSVQQALRSVANSIDLTNPSILLVVVILFISLLPIRLFTQSLIAMMQTVKSNRSKEGASVTTSMPDSETGIFYDFENEAIGIKGLRGFLLFLQLQVRSQGKTNYVYGDESKVSKDVIAGLEEISFQYIATPHDNKKQVVDKRLIRDVMRFVVSTTSETRVILVTHDNDYVSLVATLRFLGVSVEVWMHNFKGPSESASKAYKQVGATVLEFGKFL